MVTEHTRLTIVTDTGPHRCLSLHVGYSFPSVPFCFLRGPFPRRCNSVLVYTTSRTAETEISSAWQYRRNAEDFHSPAAKMTPIGEPAAASDVALPALNAFKVHLFASLWPNSVSMRRTALRNEELVRWKRVAPAPLSRSSGRCFADKPCLPQMASTSLWRPPAGGTSAARAQEAPRADDGRFGIPTKEFQW